MAIISVALLKFIVFLLHVDASHAAGVSGLAAEEGALLLLVISNAAENFPADQAEALAQQLLQVGIP